MPEGNKPEAVQNRQSSSKDGKRDVPEERTAAPRQADPKDDADGLTR